MGQKYRPVFIIFFSPYKVRVRAIHNKGIFTNYFVKEHGLLAHVHSIAEGAGQIRRSCFQSSRSGRSGDLVVVVVEVETFLGEGDRGRIG